MIGITIMPISAGPSTFTYVEIQCELGCEGEMKREVERRKTYPTP